MLDMYASKKKGSIHDQAHQQAMNQQPSSDPLLGAIGTIAGTAVGTAVGGPMGGQIGGALGGQLGGTGTVDPTKLATSMATGAVGDAATGALTDTIKENVTAPISSALDSNFMENTGMSPMEMKEYGMETSMLDYMPNRLGFSRGGPISYAACGGKMKYRQGGSYEPEMYGDLTPGQIYNLEQEMKRREMMERQYEMNRRAHEAAGEEMPEMQQFGTMNPSFYKKGGEVSDEMRVILDNEDLISRMKINQYGPQANMIREQDLYTDEERYGPLKSIKYKSSGGDVYSEEYDTKAEQARAGAEAIGSNMPGALGGMSDYLARRRKQMEEMNKLLGK